jgi:AcrR family transcriptional regulator
MPAHQISLREVARLAGISHAAPYKHFPDRMDFLIALTARCMSEFVGAQRDAVTSCSDPGERLVELGAAYADYGIANPHAFNLIFDVDVSPPGHPPAELAELITEHAALLRDSAQAATDAGAICDTTDPNAVQMALWSVVHGLTHLAIAGHIPAERVRNVLHAHLAIRQQHTK